MEHSAPKQSRIYDTAVWTGEEGTVMTNNKARRQRLIGELAQQLLWIEQCGKTLAGYIRNYGDPGIPPMGPDGPKMVTLKPHESHLADMLVPVPNKQNTFYHPYSGNGGTAIYRADLAELRRLERECRNS
jgi:hypothetical protein